MRVIIIDDEKNIRESLAKFLKLENIETITAENGLAGQRILQEEQVDGAIVDLKMPGMDGLALLEWLKSEGPSIPVIMISAFGEIQDAVEAMKQGAADYIVKPFDPEELLLKLKRLLKAKQNQDIVYAGQRLGQVKDPWIGKSSEAAKLKHLIEKVAVTDATVLISGESGTGKEVSAKYLHNLSKRREAPFVPINIGGIPETLLESELFGYEKGAFTGADKRKDGLALVASGGTLFLDEIGEMPLPLQVKMLRFLQEKKVQPLGSTKTIPVNVRIIAASNKDLKQLAAEGKFREDLYFRLNIVTLNLPPLRERKEDIPLLVGHFIGKFNQSMGKNIAGISREALESLYSYPFPGNIRELENMVERAFIFAENGQLEARDFDLPPVKKKVALEKKAGGTVKELEKQAIIEALTRWEGNRTRAAAELGITRRTLFNKIKEYGIDETP